MAATIQTQAPTIERVLRLMAEKKASDVYLSANAPATIKIEGEYFPINNQPLPPDGPLNLLMDLVPPNRIEELKETGELNMGLALRGVGNYRISGMRQRGSYAVVVRFLSPNIPTLDALRLPPVLAKLVLEKRGLVLMVGTTGAGKSTTLASMIDHRNERMFGHILTLEDPIEYIFTNKKSIINQREVGSDTAHLQIGLKNALRQAPDVIMIGEIRDRDTMTSAIAYAQSGHLCLATLHASNSYQALHRVLSFYPLEVRPTLLNDLATSLKAVVSQRLLPAAGGKIRIPSVEIMLNTKLVAELIEKGDIPGVKEAMENSLAEGSQTFEEDLARLIHNGSILREDGLAYADSPTNLLWRLQNQMGRRTAKPNQWMEQAASDDPSFTEFTLDVKPTGFGSSRFGASGFGRSRMGGLDDTGIGVLESERAALEANA
ncbi:MAG: PilT/PilU family type 4a pilus ATPase [Burkholderiaceae bacterium]|jgi:twitching motility protein PilU|nr:PilT/PilU family type 4a pilus ATPase [Burkholderiaceae bacterium]